MGCTTERLLRFTFEIVGPLILLSVLTVTAIDLYCEENSCSGDKIRQTVDETHRELKMSQAAAGMAVVVYDDKAVSPFHRKIREFSFGEFKVSVVQDWAKTGVAAVVWDAAVVLGEYIMEHQCQFNGQKVLELGAGTGLAGIVASLAGAKTTITDRKVALDIIKRNINANRHSGKLAQNSVKIKELDWGKNLQDFADPYDVVLGADIIYIEETFPQLLQTLLHVTNEKSVVFLSSKIRYSRDTRFLDMMKKHFDIEEILHDNTRDIHIYKCKKTL